MKLVTIVPAFNEAERINDTVTALKSLSDRLAGRDVKVLVYVIDDGSDDETGRLADEAGADRVIRHRTNRGLGAAVRTGLAAARDDEADLVVKFDADLQHDPADVPALIDPILADEADIVYGNRFERIQYRMPLVRRLGNSVFTFLMRRLTGWDIRDAQPGIFAVTRDYLWRFSIPGDYNYTQQVLIDAYHKSMRFAQVPVTFRQRTSGTSFVSLRYPFRVIAQILMVLVGLKPLRVFGLAGLIFLTLGGGIFIWDIFQWILGNSDKPAQHVNAILGFTLFGLQTAFFGILAQLIINQSKS